MFWFHNKIMKYSRVPPSTLFFASFVLPHSFFSFRCPSLPPSSLIFRRRRLFGLSISPSLQFLWFLCSRKFGRKKADHPRRERRSDPLLRSNHSDWGIRWRRRFVIIYTHA
jgi:hypothetical protein